MKIRARLALAIACLSIVEAPSFVMAQAETSEPKKAIEYVVTANRLLTPVEEVASSSTVITADEIQERLATESYDVLRDVPGVDVVRSGGIGGNTAVFIRGANSEHTLVLIDGVKVNNPISNARFFNFADLTVENIERIEIIRGPQSTLYGSNALGGVINIITKKGSGPVSAVASFEGGSFNTYTQRGSVSGGDDLLNYSLGVTRQESEGFSAADSDLGNSEDDGFNNLGISGRFGVTPDKDTEVSLILRRQGSTSDLDNNGGVGADDLNRVLKNKQLFVRSQVTSAYFDGAIKPSIGVSYTNEEFDDNNDPDALNSDFLRSNFQGSRLGFDLQNEWTATPWLTVLTGIETEEERGDSDYHSISDFGPFDSRFSERTARSNGYFAQFQGKFWEMLYPTAGVRLDTNSGFDSQVTWRAGPTLLLRDSGTKLFGTVGTGYKAPSLYQRFSEYGDPELIPEKSLGVDAGIEQEILPGLMNAGVTYFHNDFDHLITFEPTTYVFRNINSARTQGLESYFEVQPTEGLSVRGSYTLTKAEDTSANEELLRRPRHKFSGQVRYNFCDVGMIRLDVSYVGSRADTDFATFPSTPVTLGGYPMVTLAGSYEIQSSVELFARVENVLDREYQEVFGYGTPGVSAFGGVRFKL